MKSELINRFDVLDINTKRNQISSELMIINELINSFETKFNIPNTTKVKNYDQSKDDILSEGEVLTFFYEDIYNLEQELITLLNVID